ncbi:tail fiber protein [Nocardioides sp. LHD-245]|uniref:phage tail protein n=1 Tax=Nocardioides sp. LHD-245 TaxID=3051387 RepID=UPI0027DFB1D2|nr:tail fiber protein [Nocardioides sp. LHD-245]
MIVPFVGEVRMWAGRSAPEGWSFCDGRQLAISDNGALFQLIGTTYGGDGSEFFLLPDLRGRVPVGLGDGADLGDRGGVETVKLTVEQLPAHNHSMMGSVDPASRSTVDSSVPASMPATGAGSAYGSVQPFVPLAPSAVAPTGGGLPHDNMQPYLCVSFIISLSGIFPSRNEREGAFQ